MTSARAVLPRRARVRALLVLVTATLATTGCTHVRAWERGKLAHPTMASDFANPAEEHLHAVHEGAIGGGAGVESGCGCN
jgi:hypothetical protein